MIGVRSDSCTERNGAVMRVPRAEPARRWVAERSRRESGARAVAATRRSGSDPDHARLQAASLLGGGPCTFGVRPHPCDAHGAGCGTGRRRRLRSVHGWGETPIIHGYRLRVLGGGSCTIGVRPHPCTAQHRESSEVRRARSGSDPSVRRSMRAIAGTAKAACRSGSPPLPRVLPRLNGSTTAPRSWLPVPRALAPSVAAPVSQAPV